jgi:hypothetical protein
MSSALTAAQIFAYRPRFAARGHSDVTVLINCWRLDVYPTVG